MNDVSTTITVEDIRKLALPLGTRVIAGDGLLGRTATWTTVIYPEDPLANKSLQQDEVVLVAGTNGRAKPGSTDIDIVRWAADSKASAVVLSDMPSPSAIAEAKAYNIPLLILPPDSRIRMVEKTVVSLLVDRKGQIERRGTQIYKQLTQISSRNEGMAELINAMARLTNKAVVIQDKRLHVTEHTLQPQFVAMWEDIESFLRKMDNLPVEMQDRHRVADIDQPVLMQSLPITGMARLVAPVVTKSVGRGYLSIIGHDNDLDDIDLLVAEHGAAACALEMAKLKAVSETEKRLRGTFLDRLLIGDVSQQEAIRQGERFEHDMTQTHVAMVLAWRGDNTPSMRRLETTVNSLIEQQKANALVWIREKEREVVVFHATNPEDPIDTSLKLGQAFSNEIRRMYQNQHIAMGLGQPARDIASWRTSYRDAVQAMELAVRLQTDAPLYIGDLGVYQLILSLSDRDKLVSFCERTLGPLVDYDMRQNADLIKTLEAFFNCHGNLSQTADVLIVHRNTLLYRMNRINEIAQIDLNRPETRLALHLAITIRRLLSMN
ncbi:helix-turn-helix domain-containing protein [Phototrophicus methaneseepsis]|uniref:Helix-turn-helix domain-containing protein n=1 Tax=Phototrophicus methaneseepsis TaxID=2710758 RepID=A0A7S8E5F6_9CHLR|nr:helix-turn-helix domain-containing protein [Phototrophicus methaneseepsis]QPC80733.1 helix-turn-helix domain-containing protein [Phototrophicus methaneseepsis]